jgi:D-alanyl-D-alanine carboxypeptidase/D-alanyl-D-alanine-endopeptidase (penicillin-binding protein 4)
MKCGLFTFSIIFFFSCSPSRQITKSARENVLRNEALRTAHVGISIYEPATGKYWYNYQGDKYFVPASNTKLATCYAAMKYLGDSLVGLRYFISNGNVDFIGTGDPTFLDPEFRNQPVFDFLKKSDKINYVLDGALPTFSPLGTGWAWDDYLGDYAAERSVFPIYDNLARFYLRDDTVDVIPNFFAKDFAYSNAILRKGAKDYYFVVTRPFETNRFHPVFSRSKYSSRSKFTSQTVPFKTITDPLAPSNHPTFLTLLEDTLHKKIGEWQYLDMPPKLGSYSVIHSQPTDSLLRPMMHRSDNFFAEQSLLMVSNELLGVMNDEKIIDTLLKADFKDLPQKPRWVDGSGLSRYNLFTPQDFVFILNKMKTDFGMGRIQTILPTGNEGTLEGRFVADSNRIFAKTGTLSGVVSLSGFLYTRKNKLLIFSVLVNNHNATATQVRRAAEKFIQGIRNRY